VFVHALDKPSHDIATSEIQSIRSLSGKGLGSISVLGPADAAPTGSAVFVAGTGAAVFLEVKGRVDVDEEINKAQSKLKKAADGAAKLQKMLADGEFVEKVSPAVLEVEKAKLEELKAQEGNYERSIEQFEKLKLEG
jgi:valyl-tRNA synthetase